MKNPVYAPAVKTPVMFDESVRWIHARGVANFSEQMFRREFVLDAIPEKAFLLAMAATYAEIFVNGRSAASLTVRSYIFDKAYEVYDVTDYLIKGKNVVAVSNIDTGEAIRAGFALEIKADGAPVCVSNAFFRWASAEQYEAPINYYITGASEEKILAEKIADFTAADFDDSAWQTAEEIGAELLHEPYRRFHQSLSDTPTCDVFYAEALTALMRAENPAGLDLRLPSAGQGMTLSMTHMTLCEDTEMSFVAASGIRTIAIDGKIIPLHTVVTLAAGTHFCMFAHGGSPELFIRTKGTPQFSSPLGGEAPIAAHVAAAPKILYPWNQFRGRGAHDDVIDALLSVSSFEALSDETKKALVPTSFGTTGSLAYAFHKPDRTVPKNGFADARIYNDPRIQKTEKALPIENEAALLEKDGKTVIPAGDGMANIILDFGTERVGRLAFSLDAPAGTVLDIVFFEMLTDDGIAPMNGNNFMRYTCKAGAQEYIARRLHGFRYLSVTVSGHTSDVTISDIHLIENRCPTKPAYFESSDERLNTIYQMAARTAEVCMLDRYCDCPGFEQNPWTGDARCTALVNLYNFGAYSFDADYLKLIASSIDDGLWWLYRRRNPRYIDKLYLPCACFPTYPDGCIPVWSMMWLLQCIDHYEVTGDRETLEALYPAIKETLSRMGRMTNDRGLFDMQGAWNLIEWANNDLDFYGEVTANNVMYSYCLKKTAEIAELFGEADEAMDCRARSEAVKAAVNRYCWDEEKRAYVDTARDEYAYKAYLAYMASREMPTVSYEEYLSNARISAQSNTMALLYDCVPEERQADALRFLLDNMESGLYINGTPAKRTHGVPSEEEAPHGYVHIGSPFFLYFALSTLYKFGYHDLALKAQRRDWGAMLDNDVRTCYETFKTGKEWPRSAAHAWSATPAYFLKTEVLGVKPLSAGFERFTVTPHTGDLSYAKGSVPTPRGDIEVAWKKNEDGTLTIDCKAPKGCEWVK